LSNHLIVPFQSIIIP